MASNDIPSLADLRRGARRSKRPVAKAAPPLFNLFQPSATANASALKEHSPGQSPAPEPSAPARKPVPPKPQVWTVAGLVREVRGLVERSYGQVTVEGEISNWRPAGSGHCYFTLKDGDAQLAAVMFRRNAGLLRFAPKDGDAVRLRGQITVYENRGQMQLIVESMELAGRGALLAAVQRLKEKLRHEGLFENKRPLPPFPKCIGVITSPRGAALQDIIKVCRRRHAAVNLLIYPAAVQGPRCAADVIAGLRWFSKHADRVDVVLVARGGGSWEDLHGFNDEGVARAIAACVVPVLTGIGHEIDTTIADAAADLCAPTPSAAAEMLTAAQHHVEERVERLHGRVLRAGRYEVLRAKQRLWSTGADSTLRRVLDSLRRREQLMDELELRVNMAIAKSLGRTRERLQQLNSRLEKQAPGLRLAGSRQKLQTLAFRLEQCGRVITMERGHVLQSSSDRLHALSPLRVLERGYALVYAANGTLLRSANDAAPEDVITARLAHGSLDAVVQAVADDPLST